MFKFGRAYNLLVETEDRLNPISLALPFTLEFDVNRTYFSSANRFSLRIYNLGVNKRNAVRKDVLSFDDFRQISLQAGYGTQLSTILKGNVTQAWSVREGNNMITQIEGFDSGFAFVNGITDTQYVAGTSQKVIIQDLVTSLNSQNTGNVATGAIGAYSGTTSRGSAFSGNTTDLLRELTGGGFFVDLGTAHCLQDDECLAGQILVINSQSGLLETPTLEETIVHLPILFEPRVKIAQQILLESQTEARFNGVYKIVSVHHKGIISDAVNGPATTTLGLVAGQFTPIAQAVA